MIPREYKVLYSHEFAISGYQTSYAQSSEIVPKIEVECSNNVVEVNIPRNKYPESSKHIEDAIVNGQPEVLTIDRLGSKVNRKASLQGIDKVPGKDLDEYPPAMFKEGGEGASIRPINPSDNRGAGATFGYQLRPYSNGTKVKIKITDD